MEPTTTVPSSQSNSEAKGYKGSDTHQLAIPIFSTIDNEQRSQLQFIYENAFRKYEKFDATGKTSACRKRPRTKLLHENSSKVNEKFI